MDGLLDPLQESLMHFPTWVDLKGQDSVPETVHHVVSYTCSRVRPLVYRTCGTPCTTPPYTSTSTFSDKCVSSVSLVSVPSVCVCVRACV